MKSIVAAILIISLSSLAYGQSDFYSKHWSDVYRYERRDLPKSALLVTDTIYSTAKRDKNVSQMVKVLMYQSKFAVILQEDAELVITRRIEVELKSSKAPLRNILESVLGHIYWQYYKENRWKYYNRSRTSEKANPDDFRTWDGSAMFQEIHNHFQNSLRDERTLQAIDLATIHEILDEAENSKIYRPTLYDFLIHNALDFYKSNETFSIQSVDWFTLNDTHHFDDFEYMTSTPDSLRPQYQALKIFRKALLFHKQANDTTPYINLEIERLNYLVEIGKFEGETELHKKALQRLRETYLGHPISAMLDFEIASILLKEGNEYVPNKEKKNQFKKHEAVSVCDRAIAAFAKSDGAGKCKMLRENILSAKLQITTEDFFPINAAGRMLVEYANVDSLNFYAYKVSHSFVKEFYESKTDSLCLLKIKELQPEVTWKAGFTDLKDHQEHKTEVIIPALSQGGDYIIVAFVDPENQKSSQPTYAFQSLQITNLVLLETDFEAFFRYQVVDRVNGKPIDGAKVHFMSDTVGRKNSVFDRKFSTNEKGFFQLEKTETEFPDVVATVTYKQDQVTVEDFYIYYHRNISRDTKSGYRARSFIFTDRSIYRPGQTVFFKGILIKEKERKSSVVTGQYVEVYLDDVNGKEVSSLRLKTNSFGSFSGEFKLPATGLTGEYSIYADEDEEDESRFYDNLVDFNYEEVPVSVEEYKRPTFETTFKPVTETFRLRDSVSVKGNALAYSGAKIGGAKVKYHVNRTARFPAWHYWTDKPTYSSEAEIAFGETTTNKDGEFTVVFEAEPDEDISEDENPVFQYEVTADITDVNGETRSASETVKVGYRSIALKINAPTQLNRKVQTNVISVNSENLNDQFVPTKGTIKIYKLKSPITPMRPRPWEAPDVQRISEEEFRKVFPHDPYTDENAPKRLNKGKVVMEANFNTAVSKEVKFNADKSWMLGKYLIEATAKDPSGTEITELHRFEVFDPTSKAVSDNQIFVMESDKSSYVPGETAIIKIGSASSDMTVVISVDKKRNGEDTFVEHLSGNFKTIAIPITESMEDGLVIRCSGVNFNSFFDETKDIYVISARDKIEIETLSFKDKLQTGSKQTWSFAIKGDENAVRATEILASMYDASLDQFKAHEWSFNPDRYRSYYDRYHYRNSTNSRESFGVSNFSVRNLYYAYYNIPRQYYDQLDWFGFTITNNQFIRQQYLDRIYLAGPDPQSPAKIMRINNKTGRKGFLSGTVIDDDGAVMPGVNILLKGTTTGTVSDAEGNYEIHADKGDVLVFSFVGYTPTEVEVTRKNSINVQMQPDIAYLAEVVVVGYGVLMEKKSLSYAVGEVYADEQGTGEVVFEEALQGKVAGVQISGGFLGGSKVVIRGNSTTTSGPDALYVVDGVVVESMTIDQSDVSSFEVLKGAAATAIYGSRAANGVIIVKTKSGQKKLDEEMSKVNARRNFNETAFFIPHITTNESGQFQFTFTTPESLTRWKLQLLAHTRDLLTATKTLEAVTKKELMVTPNLPRFLRTGDEITISAKIANLSGKSKDGRAALQLINPVTGESIDEIFKNSNRNQSFKVGANANTEVSWRLTVPEGVDAIQYKVIAKAGNFSDGEQNALPVLTNKMLVTETMPLYVRSGHTKTFSLDKLKTTTSPTLQHHELTLEITSNPAWYAVQSLPYLMEYPHECTEQLFSRFYANTLATHIVNSNPTIKQVFDKWTGSGELTSHLEKNQTLKSIIIEETPWVRDAEDDSERKKRMAMLFDLTGMSSQQANSLKKLKEMQMADGSFPWFSGGRPSRFITQHVATGFGHLRKLNVKIANKDAESIMLNAVGFLDKQIRADYEKLIERADDLRNGATDKQEGTRLAKEFMESKQVEVDQIHYLYMRSFYSVVPPDKEVDEASKYYSKQSETYWQQFNLYTKGMIALIHYRNKNDVFAKDILLSLKENSITSEELGMYWKENKSGWFWHEAPVETQSLLIEAFSEIGSSDKAKNSTIDELKVWLLKNKQASSWKTTKATTEAIYALLLNGTDWLSLDNQVEATIGGKAITPDSKEPETGTGYFKSTWRKEEINSGMSEVTLAKKDNGIAWGGVYWQYFEDLDKITPASTPLKLSKKVFIVNRTANGELLTEVNKGTPLKLGDLLRVRIELSADREMEFLHMKDMRASGLEPVDVLSGYNWQEGLGYYQSTRDASTNFFFDSMQKGVYVFEYDLRVNNKGTFSNGITTIQSMYAPEFSSHSEGIRISIE